MTIADMNRLEHAAHMSMDGFQDTEAALPSFDVPALTSSRLAAIVASAAILMVSLFQLFR
ncbi:hypothetical protein [Mesorhizobium sp.]|uniref:hypothetical protein n=1 Tax=Mesorhizobium sp. TaxID=1871066 RepID=UPI00356188BB